MLESAWEEGSTEGVETVMVEAERHHIKDGGTPTEHHVAAKHAKASLGTN